MRPIRSEHERGLVLDPWTGRPYLSSGSSAVHILTDQGAVETRRTLRQIACGCGCVGPVGGFCFCGAAVCARCFSHCPCGRPLCRRHGVLVSASGGQIIRLCQSCHESTARKQVLRRVARALLSPFVEFNPDARR